MEINSQDNRFWTATLSDGYYTVAAVNANGEATMELADNNNWSTPWTDNVANQAWGRWCNPANTETVWSPF